MKDTFARRLVNARNIRRISQDELYAKLDGKIPLETIQEYETAKKMPSEEVLILLKHSLGFNIDYFLRPFKKEIDIDSLKFISPFPIPKDKEVSIKLLVAYEIEKYLEIEKILGIENSFNLDYWDFQVRTVEDAKRIALRLRRDVNIGLHPIASVVELFESIGVKIIEIDADGNFFGTYTKVEGIPFIVLNKMMTPEKKRYFAFYLMGRLCINFAKEADKNNICFIFALEALLPSKKFIQFIGEQRSEISLKELQSIQRQYGINVDCLIEKASLLNVISETQYEDYIIKKGEDPQFKKNVDRSLICDEKNSRYERLVYKALACEIITTSKAAALLECSVSEVRNNLELL